MSTSILPMSGVMHWAFKPGSIRGIFPARYPFVVQADMPRLVRIDMSMETNLHFEGLTPDDVRENSGVYNKMQESYELITKAWIGYVQFLAKSRPPPTVNSMEEAMRCPQDVTLKLSIHAPFHYLASLDTTPTNNIGVDVGKDCGFDDKEETQDEVASTSASALALTNDTQSDDRPNFVKAAKQTVDGTGPQFTSGAGLSKPSLGNNGSPQTQEGNCGGATKADNQHTAIDDADERMWNLKCENCHLRMERDAWRLRCKQPEAQKLALEKLCRTLLKKESTKSASDTSATATSARAAENQAYDQSISANLAGLSASASKPCFGPEPPPGHRSFRTGETSGASDQRTGMTAAQKFAIDEAEKLMYRMNTEICKLRVERDTYKAKFERLEEQKKELGERSNLASEEDPAKPASGVDDTAAGKSGTTEGEAKTT